MKRCLRRGLTPQPGRRPATRAPARAAPELVPLRRVEADDDVVLAAAALQLAHRLRLVGPALDGAVAIPREGDAPLEANHTVVLAALGLRAPGDRLERLLPHRLRRKIRDRPQAARRLHRRRDGLLAALGLRLGDALRPPHAHPLDAPEPLPVARAHASAWSRTCQGCSCSGCCPN